MRCGLSLMLVAALSTACAPAVGAPPVPSRRTAELLAAIAAFAGASRDVPSLADWATRIDGGQATLDSYIDEVLVDPRFGREILPALVFGAFTTVRNYYAFPSAFVLKTSEPDAAGTVVRYLRSPCEASTAVRVKPWWAPDTDVLVCPDAYRPEKWELTREEQSYKSAMKLSCDSQVGSPELETRSLCGCGPNLIRCLRDMDMYEAMNASAMREVKDTTAYVAEHDLPVTTLFTGQASFRDRNMEYYYRRQKIGALHLDHPLEALEGLDAWPEQGQWSPREELRPGQHAGMLTTPQILHWLPDRRQRQRAYFEILWCANRSSFGATTEQVLKISDTANLAFVHDSWQRLAHTPVCTECHARLDYGFQFFMGYPDSRANTHFVPELQQSGTGPLYGRDIDDSRGAAPLTPDGFAILATAQPEFQQCLTSKLTSYILADTASAEDRDVIAHALAESGRFKPAVKAALRLYAEHWRAANVAPPSVAAIATTARPGFISVSPALRIVLDAHCVDCHDQEAYSEDLAARAFDFRGAELPRALAIRMADHVAHGQMPKPPNMLRRTERDTIVRLIVEALFPDPAARAEAEHYYVDMLQSLPAHLVDNTLHMIDESAGSNGKQRGEPWGALERTLWPDQAVVTPGFVAMSALEALRVCRGRPDPALRACLAKAITTAHLARDEP